MKLLLTAENERELALGLAGNNDLPDEVLAEIGAAWTLDALDHIGPHEFQRAHQQCIGAHVIFQAGTEEEREAWAAALDKTRPAAQARLNRELELLASADAE